MAHIYSEEEDRQWREGLTKKLVSVKVLVQNERGEILLVKPIYREYWHIPGGHVESGENPLDTAPRELREETGLSYESNDMAVIDILNRPKHGIDLLSIVFRLNQVVDSSSTIQVQTEEIAEYRWVAPDQLDDYISTGSAKWWNERGVKLLKD